MSTTTEAVCPATKYTAVERAWMATANAPARLQFQQERHGVVVNVEAGTATQAGVPVQGMLYTFECGHTMFIESVEEA